MKKYISITLLSFLIALEVNAQAFESFVFFTGNYQQLQTRAKNAEKPYFIYFYANWCLPAKEMNEKTFTNSYLVSYGMENYLGIAMDGESIITDGSKLAQMHNVLYYPTLVFFTPEGKEVDRIHGFQNAATVLAKMKANANKTGAPDAPLSDFEYKIIQPEDNEGYLFDVSAKTQKYNGYGVQVGVFKNYRNVFLKVLELEEEFYHRNIMVYVKESESGDDMFKIILGPFFTREQAEEYDKLIAKKQKIDGVIVELDDLDY